MKVFNACALVIRRRYAAFLIYLVIFTALSVVMTSMSVQQNDQTFNRTKTAVAVVDRDDGSPLSQGLIAYLAQNADLKELPDDKEALQDALFSARSLTSWSSPPASPPTLRRADPCGWSRPPSPVPPPAPI